MCATRCGATKEWRRPGIGRACWVPVWSTDQSLTVGQCFPRINSLPSRPNQCRIGTLYNFFFRPLRHAIILSSLFLLNFCLGAIPTKIMREKFHRRLNCYVNTENARLRRKTLAKRDEREQRVGAPPTQSKRGWRRRGGGGGGLMLLADCTE